MREDLVDIIKTAKQMGFPQVQIASNGVRIANEPGFAQKLKDSGLSTVYLHFDGVTPATNPLLKISMKAIENLKAVRLGVVLVPTVIHGKNDHELGDIIRFAVNNVSVIRGVNFQPIAFTGAATDDDVKKLRITIPDLLNEIEIQLDGVLKKDDFYPVPCVIPFSDLVETYTGRPQIRFTAHQHCGAATYVFVQNNGAIVPVNRMVNVDKFFESIEQMTAKLKKGGTFNKYATLLEGLKNVHESVRRVSRGTLRSSGRYSAKPSSGRTLRHSKNFTGMRFLSVLCILWTGTTMISTVSSGAASIMQPLRENSSPSAPTTVDRFIGNRSGKNMHNQKNNLS
jgi:hypothetical protein